MEHSNMHWRVKDFEKNRVVLKDVQSEILHKKVESFLFAQKLFSETNTAECNR